MNYLEKVDKLIDEHGYPMRKFAKIINVLFPIVRNSKRKNSSKLALDILLSTYYA